MSDNEIRQILIERKKAKRRQERIEEIKECIEGLVAWGSLFFLGFMLSVIGG